MLSEWKIEVGARRPDPNEMTDFNVFTMNARSFPGAQPLLAQAGERVRIRLGNPSSMSRHAIHLHGHSFKVVATDGGEIQESARWPDTTVIMPTGSTRTIEFIVAEDDWMMHLPHVAPRYDADGAHLLGTSSVCIRRASGRKFTNSSRDTWRWARPEWAT